MVFFDSPYTGYCAGIQLPHVIALLCCYSVHVLQVLMITEEMDTESQKNPQILLMFVFTNVSVLSSS
jgi:hypothetical protein